MQCFKFLSLWEGLLSCRWSLQAPSYNVLTFFFFHRFLPGFGSGFSITVPWIQIRKKNWLIRNNVYTKFINTKGYTKYGKWVSIEETKMCNLDLITRKFRNFTRITHFWFFAAERCISLQYCWILIRMCNLSALIINLHLKSLLQHALNANK